MFKDRYDAARQLVPYLSQYEGFDQVDDAEAIRLLREVNQ